jgi:hypothetical protein
MSGAFERKQSFYRLLNKSGERNIKSLNLPEKLIRFTKDVVHTLIEARWRTLLLVLTTVFASSWTLFAVLYMLIAYSHGDLSFDEVTGERLSESEFPCIMNAKTFSGFFLLSVESQVSTGYGDYF